MMDKFIRKYGLSPNQYYYLVSVHENTDPYKIHPDEIKELSEKGFLDVDDSGTNLTYKSKEIFGNKSDVKKLFEEIWNMYPARTPSGRALRPKSSESKIGIDIFKKISKHLANHNTYLDIKKGLRKELAYRLQTKKLEYMNNMKTWVNNRSWELYKDEDVQDAETSVLGFQ